MQNKLESDIQKIVKFLSSRVDSLEAIYLVGSFGRNEGSILNYDGKSYVINDYDLVILAKKNQNKEKIDFLRHELEKVLSVRHVDITSYIKKELKNMNFTMYSYDLKYASKTIFGSSNFLKLIPEMDRTKMPIFEAIRPLLLFPAALLLAYPKSKKMSDIEIFWSYQQISKSILGWSSAMLIEKGLYTSSYLERSKIFENVFNDKKKFCNLVKVATNFKLEPTIKPIDRHSLNNFWKEAASAHLEVCENILCNFYNVKSCSLETILVNYKKSIRNRMKLFFTFLTGIDKGSMIHIEAGQLFLCKSLVSEEREEANKFKQLANKEKLKFLRITKNKHNPHIDLVDFFVSFNPNTQSWNQKSNKLLY